jgi:hypothetical protein
MTIIATSQAPIAKPKTANHFLTTAAIRIVEASAYLVPLLGFASGQRIARGVVEFNSPLLVSNVSNAAASFTARIQRRDPSVLSSEQLAAAVVGEAELITNGTFATDIAGWSAVGGATLTWDPLGYLSATNIPPAATFAQQTVTTVVGTPYFVSVNFVAPSAGTRYALLVVSGNLVAYRFEPIVTTTSRISFVARDTSSTLTLIAFNANPALVDTVSLKAVPAAALGPFTLVKDYLVEPGDTAVFPLNGQFLAHEPAVLAGDYLDISASANSALVATVSYTEGQAEEDDVA